MGTKYDLLTHLLSGQTWTVIDPKVEYDAFLKHLVGKKTTKLSLEKAQELMDKDGNLDLCGSNYTELPENLTVEGYLNISGTPITKLPRALCVKGDLKAINTKLTDISPNMKVKGTIYCQATSILVDLAFEGFKVKIQD